ncbi:hypothetical protein V8E54_011418 [Elaphomyces granulatus]
MFIWWLVQLSRTATTDSVEINEHHYTVETLQQTSILLTKNPEYYTIWNFRRLILQHQLSLPGTDSSELSAFDQIVSMIKDDLQFLLPLLRSYPKCYWIWNYRLWLLGEASRLLPSSTAHGFWQEELALVNKMLSFDDRNFHGWGYRRLVVEKLEILAPTESMTQKELDYTTKMIRSQLSNFSAWHNRTKLIQTLLDERGASDDERKDKLDDELELIHQALIDPYDQSLWFYHQNLMCTFDPALSAQAIAPNLTDSERLDYIRREKEAIEDMLEGAEGCKWIYQGLMNCTLLQTKIERSLSRNAKQDVTRWLHELIKLDPKRRGRWLDFEESFNAWQ